MANYLACVELYAAEAEDYERLHRGMESRGFVHAMAGEDGVRYELPRGAYVVSGTSAMLSVALRAAVDAAAETGRKAAVMVTDWEAARWSGLAEG